MIKRLTLAAFIGAALLCSPGLTTAAEPVDLELVIATDVSRSIDHQEALLQREGVAAAFRSPEVINAIKSGILGKIAVAYIDYSSRPYNQVIVDWTQIANAANAEAFVTKLLDAPLSHGRRTSISDAVEQAAEMIEGNAFEGTRRVIDVAGDGPNNYGKLVNHVRDDTIKKRITINGLPIIDNQTGPGSRFYLEDLDKYYKGCVIGGVGAFMIIAKDFNDFAIAFRKKLIFEIAGMTPETQWAARRPPLLHLAQFQPPPGFVYEKGCDIGERIWRRIWGDWDDGN